MTLGEIALSTLHEKGQHQIMATASYVSPDSPPPYAAQFAEVEVDVETGQVTVLQLVMAVDCGVPINPVTASGQVEGGMVQALGYAHCEEMAYDDDGRMVNAAFGPYKIYRADEMPTARSHPRADHGGQRALRRQGDRGDPARRSRPRHPERHCRRDRGQDQQHPVHARACLAGPAAPADS